MEDEMRTYELHLRCSALCLRPGFLIGLVLGVSLTAWIALPVVILASTSTSLYNTYGSDQVHASDTRYQVRRDIGPMHSMYGRQQKEHPLSKVEGRSLSYTNRDVESEVLSRWPEPSSGWNECIYAAVLTAVSRLRDAATAVRLTWGTTIHDHQFFFGGGNLDQARTARAVYDTNIILPGLKSEDTYKYEHVWRSLAYVCQTMVGRYGWYIIVTDTTYINPPALHAILSRISPTDPIILGGGTVDGTCDVEEGMVMSMAALKTVCGVIGSCRASPHDIPRCLHQRTAISCLDAAQISKHFHKKLDANISDVVASMDTSFLSVSSGVQDLYRVHQQFLDLQISHTRLHINRLARELRHSSPGAGPGWSMQEKHSPTIQHLVANGTTEPYAQLIDSDGYIYTQACHITRTDVEQNSVYHNMQSLADKEVKRVEQRTRDKVVSRPLHKFGYKVEKPNTGAEYHLLQVKEYRQRKTTDGGGEVTEQVVKHAQSRANTSPDTSVIYQATILQKYGELHVDMKETMSPELVHLLVEMPNSVAILDNLLGNCTAACAQLLHDATACWLWLMTPDGFSSPSYDSLIKEYTSVYQSRTHPLIVNTVNVTSSEPPFQAGSVFNSLAGVLPESSLVAWIDQHSIFQSDFLFRCQLNAFAGKRVYFPIAFQMYSSANVHSGHISDVTGFWRSASYDTMCAYMFDVLPQVSGARGLSDLYHRFKAAHYELYRAPDPSLWLPWRSEWCKSLALYPGECQRNIKYTFLQ